MFRGRRTRHTGNFGVMLLAAQLYNFGFKRIPPVTLITILSQVAIFLGLGDLTRWFSSSYNVCISTHLVLRQGQWRRLILGSLYHGSDMHLYYNMISFLVKGSMLERKFHGVYFAYLLTVFTALTSVLLVGLNYALAVAFADGSYELTCAVGFSAVIFALKVLAIHYSPSGLHYAMGFIPVPSKYIFWVELVLIQILVPNVSFTGHLAGILVGLAYTKGPLKLLMDSFISPGMSEEEQIRLATEESLRPQPGVPSAPPREDVFEYRDRGYTDRYTAGLDEREQLQRATDASRRDPSGYNGGRNNIYPDLDDLRQRRENKYN